MRLLNVIADLMPQEGGKALFSGFLLALALPAMLVLATAATGLWILAYPGGEFLLTHLANMDVSVGKTSFSMLQVLFIVSAAHCLIAGYEDKIRTRSYLHFLILLNFCIFVYIGLQPVLSVHLMSFLLIGVSILAGHLFVLTNSRSANIFFICAFIGLFILLGFNIWTLL